MPRKVAKVDEFVTVTDDSNPNTSFLDNFLESVTETVNLPSELKRNLQHLRELDTQSQELFEKMQKQSKNHVAKAKRSVAEGREPDEEHLAKARRSYRDLMDLDEEKLDLADHMYAEVTRHFEHCKSELGKFEEELKEKGQLKTPQMKSKQGQPAEPAAEPTYANGAGPSGLLLPGAEAGGGAAEMPPPLGAGGRRGRNSSGGVGGGADLPSVGAPASNSHKRGRGRKVSFKEAERQRQAAAADAATADRMNRREAMVAESRPAEPPPAQAVEPYDELAAGGMPPSFNYPDPHLPLAAREDSNLPLCGAVPANADYVIPDRTKVCARPVSDKMEPQDWILGTVLRYEPARLRYFILDEEESDADPYSQQPSTASQHQVASRMIMSLPLSEPSMYTPYNEFPRNTWVLALYPDTTCFYKALVNSPPSERRAGPPRDYLVEFEDEQEASGRGEPMRVPQKYVLRLQA